MTEPFSRTVPDSDLVAPDELAGVSHPGGGQDAAAMVAAGAVSTAGRRRSNATVFLAAGWLLLIIGLTACAELLPMKSPNEIPTSADAQYLQRPGFRLKEPLGTDRLGRSEISRAIYGARASLGVGFGAALIGLTIGTALGISAGYFRGVVDGALDIVTTTFLAFPPLIFLIAIVAILQPGFDTVVIALAFLSIPLFIRVSRANAMAFSNREFILAARSMGAGRFRLIFRELLPNVMLPMISYTTLVIVALIVAEGALSYLGLGIQPPTPSWGKMMSEGFQQVRTDPHLVLVPASVFFMTVFSLNVLGDWTRARLGRAGGR